MGKTKRRTLAKSACLRFLTLIRCHPIAGECFALIESNRRCWGPNGVSEWVWRGGASRIRREIQRAGSRCRCARSLAGDLLGGGRGRLDDHDRDHALQRIAAVTGWRALGADLELIGHSAFTILRFCSTL